MKLAIISELGKKGLKQKILWPVFLVLILALGVLIFSAYQTWVQFVTTSTVIRMDDYVKDRSRDLDNWTVDRFSEVIGWANEALFYRAVSPYFISSVARQGVDKILKSKVDLLAQYQEISVTNSNGYIIASSNKMVIGKTPSHTDMWLNKRKGMAGRFTESIVHNKASKLILTIVAPIKRNEENFGFVYADIPLSYIERRFLQHIRLGNSARSFFFLENGLLLAKSTPDLPLWKNFNDHIKQAKNIQVASSITPVQAHQFKNGRIAKYMQTEQLGWSVYADVLKSELEEPAVKQVAWNLIIALLLVTTVGAIIAILLSRPIREIEIMADQFREVADGKFNLPIDTTRNDELGRLSISFAKMASSIQQKIDELHSEIMIRQIAENALAISETHLLKAQEIGSLGSYEIDLKTNKRHWSNSLLKVLRMEALPNDTSFEKASLTVHPEDREHWLAFDRQRHERAERGHLEYRVITGEGEVRNMELTEEPVLDHDGNPNSILGIVHDVTERKIFENDLRKAKEVADLASQSKSKFLASASHDLRQPMQAISLFSDALCNMLTQKGELDKTLATRTATKLSDSVDNLGDLLNSLYNISQLDVGVTQFNIEPVRIQDILDNSFRDYADIAEKKQIIIKMVNSSAIVMSDKSQLQNMLNDLLSNAIKFTHAGVVLIGCRRSNGAIDLQVIDTGIGIPQEKIDTIFQEFTQLGNSARNRELGIGLGLAIVDRIAKKLNHPLEVKSQFSKGSVFSITLPIVNIDGFHKIENEYQIESLGGVGARILIIDDDTSVLEATKAVTEIWGFDPITFARTKDALKWLETSGNDIEYIIADYRLSGKASGLEFILRAREIKDKFIPAVVISGDTDMTIQKQAQSQKCRFLSKPVVPAGLRKELNNLLN